MSLIKTLSYAQYGISSTERKLTATSNNISNADREGYTRKSYSDTGTLQSGAVSGVVDRLLARRIDSERTTSSYATIMSNYLAQYDSALGGTDGDSGVSAAADALVASLGSLESSPELASNKASVASDLETLTDALRTQSQGIQSLRQQADSDIAGVVDDINTLVRDIDTLNNKIIASTDSATTADLEDQRATAISQLSGKIGISYFYNDTGAAQIYTSSGQILLGSSPHTLAFSTTGSINGDTLYPANLSAITLNGADITTSIRGGELGALVELRDTTLVQEQQRLDNYAVTLMDSMNAAHNKGTAQPAPSTLTGYAGNTGATAINATGNLRIATVDANGVVSDTLDIDLTTIATMSDLIAALNTVPNVNASLSADGRLVISSTDPNLGIALNEMNSSETATGEGMSYYLGLNNLFDTDSISAEDIYVRSDIISNGGLLASATLSSSATLAAGDTGITSGDNSITQSLLDLFENPINFPAAGGLVARSDTLSGYAQYLTATSANRISNAASQADTANAIYQNLSDQYTNQSGVNVDEELTNVTVLQNAYAANAQVISVAKELFQKLLDAVS